MSSSDLVGVSAEDRYFPSGAFYTKTLHRPSAVELRCAGRLHPASHNSREVPPHFRKGHRAKRLSQHRGSQSAGRRHVLYPNG
jgi:hypothetical protein